MSKKGAFRNLPCPRLSEHSPPLSLAFFLRVFLKSLRCELLWCSLAFWRLLSGSARPSSHSATHWGLQSLTSASLAGLRPACGGSHSEQDYFPAVVFTRAVGPVCPPFFFFFSYLWLLNLKFLHSFCHRIRFGLIHVVIWVFSFPAAILIALFVF